MSDDRELLEKLLERNDLRDSEREAFEDMLESLADRIYLTPKQRAWVVKRSGGVADNEYENLVSSGKVSAVCTVPTLPVLQNLPKRPPPRRTE